MNHLYGQCEGLLSSPIEPLYTTNTSRLLVFYLMFLPIALQMLNVMAPVGTVLVTAAVGYAMLGMDEITHQIEQPFRVIPMQQLSTRILSDVCDAFVCAPPALTGSDRKESHKEFRKPAYW
jgi:predicted membrane chloride channel (bestrophin family)